MGIETYIPFGAGNAISRQILAGRTGENDRTNRQNIERARCAGHMIIASPDGGYYRVDPSDLKEGELEAVERQYWQNYYRATSLFVSHKPFKKLLKAHGRPTKPQRR